MIVLGKNVKIYIGDVLVAGAKSCTFRLSQSFIDVSSPMGGRFLEKVPTSVAWDMSVSGLVANVGSPVDSLTDLLLAGTQVVLKFEDGANKPRVGWAYVKQCDRSGNVGAFATYSASFEGSGEFVDVSKYLCFMAQQDGSTVGYTITGTVNKDIYTSTDGINWTAWDGTSKTLNQGESFYVWNKVGSLSILESNYLQFTMSGSIAASGDISSMINFNALTPYCYYYMFSGCTSLTTAPSLPATTLADSCYDSMFYGCTSLTTAPSLPATTLANYCYYYMFYGCTSLTTAPLLPATTLANYCYRSMFQGCTSLTTAPSLPATTLASNCYYSMFQGCTSLTTAPSLPATTLANYCYSSMFQGCTSLTTALSLPATTLADNCYYYMFYGCTSLVTAPELPATTLVNNCYYRIFSGCTSLNHIKLSYTGSFSDTYFSGWVDGVGSSGNFYYNGSDTTRGINAIPNGWTVQRF